MRQLLIHPPAYPQPLCSDLQVQYRGIAITIANLEFFICVAFAIKLMNLSRWWVFSVLRRVEATTLTLKHLECQITRLVGEPARRGSTAARRRETLRVSMLRTHGITLLPLAWCVWGEFRRIRSTTPSHQSLLNAQAEPLPLTHIQLNETFFYLKNLSFYLLKTMIFEKIFGKRSSTYKYNVMKKSKDLTGVEFTGLS